MDYWQHKEVLKKKYEDLYEKELKKGGQHNLYDKIKRGEVPIATTEKNKERLYLHQRSRWQAATRRLSCGLPKGCSRRSGPCASSAPSIACRRS